MMTRAFSIEKKEEVIVSETDSVLRALLEQGADSSEAEHVQITSFEGTDPEQFVGVFDIPMADFATLSFDERLQITKRASEVADEFVDSVFDNSEADWILVGGTPPTVLLWGGYRDTLSDDEITAIAVKTGSVPFFYSRPEFML